jgi:hypothetical protein
MLHLDGPVSGNGSGDEPVAVNRELVLASWRARPIVAVMPEKETIERVRKDKREGKSASTQAGEFVREEMRHVRKGKHGARSTKQAIAIGLSKARRAGVKLKPPPRVPKPRRRTRTSHNALVHEGRAAPSRESVARQAKSVVQRRTAAERTGAARKAARTKGPERRRAAARKAARTRKAG